MDDKLFNTLKFTKRSQKDSEGWSICSPEFEQLVKPYVGELIEVKHEEGEVKVRLTDRALIILQGGA